MTVKEFGKEVWEAKWMLLFAGFIIYLVLACFNVVNVVGHIDKAANKVETLFGK